MNKRKVQVVIFCTALDGVKQFLLLQVNKKRGLFWQNITGGVENNEEVESAAIREAKEETSIEEDNIINLHRTNLSFKFHSQWGEDIVEDVFLLQAKNKWDVILDPSEHINFRWIDETEVNKECVKFESNYNALTKALNLKC